MGQILLAPLPSLKKRVNNGFRHHAIDSLGPLFSALNFSYSISIGWLCHNNVVYPFQSCTVVRTFHL